MNDNHKIMMPISGGERLGQIQRILLTAQEAAQVLAISPRTLWTLTATGEIQPVRIGRMVRYDVDDLRSWIERRKVG